MIPTTLETSISGTTVMKNLVAVWIGSVNRSWMFSARNVPQDGSRKNFTVHIVPR